MLFKKSMDKKKDEKLKVDIKVTYNNGAKRENIEFKAYALFGKWFVNNFRKIRIVDIKFQGDY